MQIIRTEGLKKSFSGRVIFEDAELTVEAGSIVGICGQSGIGKSTFAKILCGILKPDAGKVFFKDRMLCGAGTAYDRPLGLGIQMVRQQPFASLDPCQKIKEGLSEIISVHSMAKSKAESDKLIEKLLLSVGLEPDIAAHLPHQISGGEAQRIAVAGCLLFHPELLILDEATSMLDVSTQANVIALVKREIIQNGGSVLLISHDTELVNCICDEIYDLKNTHLVKRRKE